MPISHKTVISFYNIPFMKGLSNLTFNCLILSAVFVFGSVQAMFHIAKMPQFKKGNSDHSCLTMVFSFTLAILLLLQHFLGYEKHH